MNDTNNECSQCDKKTTKRSPEELKQLTNRLNRIQGQINGIKKMLEREAYCTDILVQVSAARAAMDGFSKELLSQHISGCVMDHLKNGDDSVIDELVKTIQKMM